MINFINNTKGSEPAIIVHNLHSMNLCSDDSLLELLKRTPPENIRSKIAIENYKNQFNTSIVTCEYAQKIFERKATSFWITLHRVERDPVFNIYFLKMAKAIQQSLDIAFGKILYCTGSIFISSGSSTTPFHFDYGNNLLLQLRGLKHFQVYSPNDEKIVSQSSLEEFFSGNPNPPSLRYSKKFDTNAIIQDLSAGTGVYMPSTSPHCTTTKISNDISVTLSLSYVSPNAERLRRVNIFDHKFPFLKQYFPRQAKDAIMKTKEAFHHLRNNEFTPRHKNFIPLSLFKETKKSII